MRWKQHTGLCDVDMDRLTGTDLMAKMVRTRIMIKFDQNDKIPTYEELGLYDCKCLYYVRHPDNNQMRTIEILFESDDDLDNVNKHLIACKFKQK